MGPDACFVRPDLMDWKYFAPHPFWTGARSYILESDGVIAAHGCISPVRFAGGIASMQIIDWAAGPKLPGGGLLLYRNCLALTDTLLAIGGSEATQRLIPKVKWFREMPCATRFARPLRPVRQVLANPKNWKLPVRLGRNLLDSLAATPSSSGWRCEAVARFAEAETPTVAACALQRTAAWLNYLLDCPAAQMCAFELYDRDVRRGQVVLSRIGHQVRIADLSIAGDSLEDWIQAVAAITLEVKNNPEIYEIAAASSLPWMCQALERCGFQKRGTIPIHLADPKKRIPPGAVPEVDLAIGDGFYLADASDPFWS
jgi:hypothetical protein